MRKTPGYSPHPLLVGDIPPFYPCAARPATITLARDSLAGCCRNRVEVQPSGAKELRENSYCVVPSGLDCVKSYPALRAGLQIVPSLRTDSSGDSVLFHSLKPSYAFLSGTTKVVPRYRYRPAIGNRRDQQVGTQSTSW